MMNYLIEQCLYPIIDGIECVGQGFIADGFFITAAHVINNYPECFVEIDNSRIDIGKLSPIYIGRGDVGKNPKAEDVAIFIFDNVHSFLRLSARKVKPTDYIKGSYNGVLIRCLSNQPHPDEPWTPEYFNKKAREQVEDAFE